MLEMKSELNVLTECLHVGFSALPTTVRISECFQALQYEATTVV